ncbi:MAG: YraN family protein [Pseudomonadota bacterium]
MKKKKNTGKLAEEFAATYLKKNNVRIVSKNYLCRFGEIDLIGIEKNILIFIEVRYRKNERYLSAVETIDQTKCNKIITTSKYYLNEYKKYQSYFCRYDVITITGDFQQPVIEWIKNAFQA